jgi:hypothetical protein
MKLRAAVKGRQCPKMLMEALDQTITHINVYIS